MFSAEIIAIKNNKKLFFSAKLSKCDEKSIASLNQHHRGTISRRKILINVPEIDIKVSTSWTLSGTLERKSIISLLEVAQGRISFLVSLLTPQMMMRILKYSLSTTYCIEKGQPERENVENKGEENHGDKADDREERNTDIEDVLDSLEEARE